MQWTMHPWERDARMARKALDGRPQAYGLLIELACTRSSDELLGARKAYQSLYGESIEEDVASRVEGIERQVSTTFSNVFFLFFFFASNYIWSVWALFLVVLFENKNWLRLVRYYAIFNQVKSISILLIYWSILTNYFLKRWHSSFFLTYIFSINDGWP